MKRSYRLLFLLLFIIILTACATVSSAGGAKPLRSEGDLYKEKKQKGEKLLFEDWKYKGFGQILPVWLEAAFKNDVSAIKKRIPELSKKEILLVRASGFNSDQAEQCLKLKLAESIPEYTILDSSWALLSEKTAANGNYAYPYFAAAVLYKEEK